MVVEYNWCAPSVIGDFPKLLAYSSACKKAGVAVLPPHINESHAAFTCTKQGIRFGLHAVKNVGIALIEKLERERQAHGAFTDLYDFCERMQGIELNKRALESLIQSGALDGLGWNRRQMLTQADAVLSAAKETAATQAGASFPLSTHSSGSSGAFFDGRQYDCQYAGAWLGGDPGGAYGDEGAGRTGGGTET